MAERKQTKSTAPIATVAEKCGNIDRTLNIGVDFLDGGRMTDENDSEIQLFTNYSNKQRAQQRSDMIGIL